MSGLCGLWPVQAKRAMEKQVEAAEETMRMQREEMAANAMRLAEDADRKERARQEAQALKLQLAAQVRSVFGMFCAAFAGESQANRRYLYFAKMADVEGYPEIAGNFRETAEGETGHAHGHLDYIRKVGDPATGLPIGDTASNLAAAVAGETHEYTDMYPGMAKTAREEGFTEIADWFETLAKAEKSHAGRFQALLDDID